MIGAATGAGRAHENDFMNFVFILSFFRHKIAPSRQRSLALADVDGGSSEE
jgi:hypothetical protein